MPLPSDFDSPAPDVNADTKLYDLFVKQEASGAKEGVLINSKGEGSDRVLSEEGGQCFVGE